MSEYTQMQNYELVIFCLCDMGVEQHKLLNKNLINSTRRAYKTEIAECSDYLSVPGTIESITKDAKDGTKTKKRLSAKKTLRYLLGKIKSCNIVRQACLKKPYQKDYKNNSLASELPWNLRLRLAQKVAGVRNSKLASFKHRGIDIGKHLCIDSSLNLKIPYASLNPKDNWIEWIYLKSKAFYICCAIEMLERITSSITNKDRVLVMSSSVYGIDWATKEWCRKENINHVFIEHSPHSRANGQMAKIYTSGPEDIMHRRNLQEVSHYTKQELLESLNYSLKYLSHRLSKDSFHRYSPLRMDLNVAERILNGLNSEKTEIWVYYTNSPDELTSIEHAVDESGMRKQFEYLESGVAQDEYESIELLAKKAKNYNAILVIRIHPRLGKNKRDSQISPELDLIRECCNKAKKINPKIVIIEPEENVNSYELAIWSDKYFSFRGTMPLELSLAGLKPLVIAKNKSIMNYWIKNHADDAPANEYELEMYLSSASPTQYCEEELKEVIWQIWTVQARDSISLQNEITKEEIISFINSFNTKKIRAIKANHGMKKEMPKDDDHNELNTRTRSYLKEVYKLLKETAL